MARCPIFGRCWEETGHCLCLCNGAVSREETVYRGLGAPMLAKRLLARERVLSYNCGAKRLRAMVQQPTNRVERRLSAILAADVAGYSRLMHNDEETTHARLSMLLTDAVEPSIAQHGGRVVKNTGDWLLQEYRSQFDSVEAPIQSTDR